MCLTDVELGNHKHMRTLTDNCHDVYLGVQPISLAGRMGPQTARWTQENYEDRTQGRPTLQGMCRKLLTMCNKINSDDFSDVFSHAIGDNKTNKHEISAIIRIIATCKQPRPPQKIYI